MRKISRDQSISGEAFDADPNASPDRADDEPALTGVQQSIDLDEAAQHNVWDEPALRAAGIAPSPNVTTYASWYRAGLERTSALRSWSVTLLLALAGGPFAVFGAFLLGRRSGLAGFLSIVVLVPVLEEMLKVGATMIVLENRPYLFRSAFQLVIAVVGSALVFAAIENIFYIYLYHPQGTSTFRIWRWTVCIAMHTGASLVAALGLLRTWRAFHPGPEQIPGQEQIHRPQIELAYPYVVTAVVIHGTYNALATVSELAVQAF